MAVPKRDGPLSPAVTFYKYQRYTSRTYVQCVQRITSCRGHRHYPYNIVVLWWNTFCAAPLDTAAAVAVWKAVVFDLFSNWRRSRDVPFPRRFSTQMRSFAILQNDKLHILYYYYIIGTLVGTCVSVKSPVGASPVLFKCETIFYIYYFSFLLWMYVVLCVYNIPTVRRRWRKQWTKCVLRIRVKDGRHDCRVAKAAAVANGDSFGKISRRTLFAVTLFFFTARSRYFPTLWAGFYF